MAKGIQSLSLQAYSSSVILEITHETARLSQPDSSWWEQGQDLCLRDSGVEAVLAQATSGATVPAAHGEHAMVLLLHILILFHPDWIEGRNCRLKTGKL